MDYLDTYALIEVGNNNPNYGFIYQSDYRVCDIILSELYWVLLREGKEDEAKRWLKKLHEFSETTYLSILIEAVKFRSENKSLNLSFPDAVGYIHSRSKGGAFVTGDKGFEKLPHVKYIK
jgi:predicted nucleic acid-binding protein